MFREAMRWVSDNKPETTPAIVIVSGDGRIVMRREFKHWNKTNKSYSVRGEHVYKHSTNRGKQVHEKPSWKGMYEHVTIRGRAYSIHRLVALAWIPNPLKLPQVNHLNGIRNDNRIENLEWCTNLMNMQHANSTGMRDNAYEAQIVMDSQMVTKAEKMKEQGYSCRQIGIELGVSHETVRCVLKKTMGESYLQTLYMSKFAIKDNEKFTELVEQGASKKYISRKFECSIPTVYATIKRLGL